jgi:hypothetical protein
MSKKYIPQVNNQNFIYPNNTLAEYDIDIIHEVNDNSVSGSTSGFTAVYNGGTGNIDISFSYVWNKNSAEPYIDSSNLLHVLSVHMMDPSKTYYKPWRCISNITSSSVSASTLTGTTSFSVTPAQMGISTFWYGIYTLEIRMIGHRAIYPICYNFNPTGIATPTPTPYGPTPTVSQEPTPTPTLTPTFTSTPTPTPTITSDFPTVTPTEFVPTPTVSQEPTSTPVPPPTPTITPGPPPPTSTPATVDQCYCFPIVVTGSTIPGPEGGVIATLTYNNCFGTRVVRAFTVGPGTYYQCIQVSSSVVQYDPIETTGIDQSYLTLTYLTGNCNTGYDCSGYTPRPTPTPTITSDFPTVTPTLEPPPTPTITSDFPTVTPTPVPPTPTPTPNPPTATPTDYDYYSADVYPCTDCGGSTDTILVAFAAGSSVTLNRFYLPAGGPDGSSYRVTSTASAGIAYILTTSFGSFTTCTLACGA